MGNHIELRGRVPMTFNKPSGNLIERLGTLGAGKEFVSRFEDGGIKS